MLAVGLLEDLNVVAGGVAKKTEDGGWKMENRKTSIRIIDHYVVDKKN